MRRRSERPRARLEREHRVQARAARSRTRDAANKELSPDAPTVHVVLDEPRFDGVRARLRGKDQAGAAKAFDDARAASPGDADTTRACALDYAELGRLHRDAGEDAIAAVAFDRIPEACTLSAHAALYAGGAYARLGRTDDAIARARRVPDDAAVAPDARLLLAEALAAKGDRASALPIWRAHLAASPHGTRWVDTCVKVATALLDGIDGPPADRAREAFDLATRVVVEAPKLADGSGGQAARDRAVALLRATDPKLDDALSIADHVRRAQGWLDANEPARAIAEVTPLLALGAPNAPIGADVCHGAIVRAQATAKLHGATADAYGDAIARCAGGAADDALPGALFAGAKASLSSKHFDEGIARFAELERLFPHHRLADDARLRAAVALQQNGDLAKGEALLASLADDYPEGDMRGEALFRVALARMVRSDWAGAKEPLDRASALEEGGPSQPELGARGVLPRAGRGDDGRSGRRGRSLRGADRARAARVLHDPGVRPPQRRRPDPRSPRPRRSSGRRSPRAPRVAPHAGSPRAPHPPPSPAAARCSRSARPRTARRERARVLADGVDPEVLWLTALLYEQAGFPDVAELVVGARLGRSSPTTRRGMGKRAGGSPSRARSGTWSSGRARRATSPALTWAVMRQESAFVADAEHLGRLRAHAADPAHRPRARARHRARGRSRFAQAPRGLDHARREAPGRSARVVPRQPRPRDRGVQRRRRLRRALARGANEDFDLWVEEIPYEETRNYLKRVIGNQAAYAFLYAPEALGEVFALPAKVTR